MWFDNGLHYPAIHQQPRNFENKYTCWPTIMHKDGCEEGDKLILPQSALDALAGGAEMDGSPMMFELTHDFDGQEFKTHCGVREFSAPEGKCFVPFWIMNNLQIEPGRIITLKKKELPKGTYVKLRPSTTDFLDISNPKAVLEKELRKFTCLTLNDTICIQYNDKNFYIDIRELKPANAVCIIQTDCFTDFEEPEDYRKHRQAVKPPQPPEDQQAVVFNKGESAVEKKANENSGEESSKEEEKKLKAFPGRGRRLDNKGASSASDPSESSSVKNNNGAGASTSVNGASKNTTFQRGGVRSSKFSKKKSLQAFKGGGNKLG